MGPTGFEAEYLGEVQWDTTAKVFFSVVTVITLTLLVILLLT